MSTTTRSSPPGTTDKTIPANITFELLWGDDALAPDKALTIYDDLKSKGLLVERVSGSPEGMALKDLLVEDKIGATSQSTSPAYLSPPGNIFTNAPIYTDQMAAVAEWFMESWTDTSRKPQGRLSDRRQHSGPQHRHSRDEGLSGEDRLRIRGRPVRADGPHRSSHHPAGLAEGQQGRPGARAS